jgi:hypothetical protein
LLILRAQLHERFEHSLGSIRAILAEIEAFKNLFNLFFVLPFEAKGNTFSFSSFREPDKCAVEHGAANADASADASFRTKSKK